MDLWTLILWFIIYCYCIYFVAQIIPPWPMRALTFDSCVLLTYSHQCNFLNTSIFSDNVWCFRTISYIYCSGIRISHFFKDPLLTFWKMILEKRFEWDLPWKILFHVLFLQKKWQDCSALCTGPLSCFLLQGLPGSLLKV